MGFTEVNQKQHNFGRQRVNSYFPFRFILTFIGFIVLLLIVIYCVYLNDKDSIEQVMFKVPSQMTSESIKLYKTDNKYYAFLPSYTDFSTLQLDIPSQYSVIIDNNIYENDGFFSEFDAGKEYEIEIRNTLGLTVSRETLVIMKSENIPSLSISLIDGTLEDVNSSTKKTVSKTGTCSLIMSNGKTDYNGDFQKFYGRGNTTWGMAKKPYNMTFKNDVNFLNMGQAQKYCLLANAFDQSNIKNKIAYDLAKKIQLKHAVDSSFVDLYVNGDYLGLYLLAENIEIAKNRIDITDLEVKNKEINSFALESFSQSEKQSENQYLSWYSFPNNPSDITGGYLVETTLGIRDDTSFITNSGTNYHIRSPKSYSYEEVKYICSVFNRIENSDNNLWNTLDMDSWIKTYFIEEAINDSEPTSLYFYKDSDLVDTHLYAGPVWDCDLTLGIVSEGSRSPEGLSMKYLGPYRFVTKNNEFQKQLKESYLKNYRNKLEMVLQNQIDYYANSISKSFYMDRLRWNNALLYDWIVKYDTLEEHVSQIKDYLHERMDYLDTVWLDTPRQCKVYYESNNPVVINRQYLVVNYGATCELPEYDIEGYNFLGWYDYVGAKYNPKEPICENKSYVAKWEKIGNEPVKTQKNGIVNNIYSLYKDFSHGIGNNLLLLVAIFLLLLIILLVLSIRQNHIDKKRKKHGK